MRAKAQWCERMGHSQGAPKSPSVPAGQGLTWVKATSPQGFGGSAGDAGLHPEEKQPLKYTDTGTAWTDWHFRERPPAAVPTHPNAPSLQMRNQGLKQGLHLPEVG